jgi:hypothetical protein
MSKNKLRLDKTCLNCNYVVENKFCPNCGQENTETRKTFHHLFIHFFEDLTHYENSFWKTIKNLMFKPGSLSKEYLSGKRLSYLAPIRLYIFVSFITFFLIAILPKNKEDDFVKFKENNNDQTHLGDKVDKKNAKKTDFKVQSKHDNITFADEIDDIEKLRKIGILKDKVADSMIVYFKEKGKLQVKNKKNGFLQADYNSVAQMDSIEKVNPDEINNFEYWFSKRAIILNSKYSDQEIGQKLLESISHNFPKTLFIYMPLFAFLLWLFHNKKKWFYFDHGIFTLHYFSFLLLTSLLLTLNNFFFSFFDSKIISILKNIINVVIFGWMIYYFFPAHQRFYQETRLISFFKSSFLFFINIILATTVLALLVFYSLVSID